MERLVLKSVWNALAIVGLVLGIWFLMNYGNTNGDGDGTSTIIGKGPVLEAVKHVNKQIFVEHYSVIDVEHSEVPTSWFPFVKQNMVVLLRGRVPAGFNLQQITEDSIWISPDGKRIQLTLPPPEVFEENVSIDFENSRIISVKDTCPDFICESMIESYQSKVLPAGRDMLIKFSYEHDILQQTAEDGKVFYEQILRSLGFEEVRVVVQGYGV